MSRHFESGYGTDDEPASMTDERRQFNEELNDFAASLEILGEDKLVADVKNIITSNDNTEDASRVLRDLEKQLVEVLDTDEDAAVEILRDFVGEKGGEEDVDDLGDAA